MSATTERATVSVIVPTTALAVRRSLIDRAIDSILEQTGLRAIPTVIVNGSARDPDVTRALMADGRLRVHIVEEGGLANALQVGRRLVDTPWFAELDDDDILLPHALESRVEALVRHEDHDCVVTNGYRRRLGEDTLHVADMDVIERDPIRAFWDFNWLLPGSYLCRTDRVRPDLFDGSPDFLECSYLALRLATTYRIRFLQNPTVIWHQCTPASLSNSRAYILSQPQAHEHLLKLELPPYARRKVLERIVASLHSGSDFFLGEGAWLEAWRWHLRCLLRQGGYRYLPYTRKLLRSMLIPKRVVP
jgi:glycosyltransferase involved in cell wall biosynthesis